MDFNSDAECGKLLPLSPEAKKRNEIMRIRSDKISSLMGQYLLTGWRMLDECCSDCQSILLMRPAGDRYCVACCEVDKCDSLTSVACQPICAPKVPSPKMGTHSSGDDDWSVINKPGSKSSSHHASDVLSTERKPLQDGKTTEKFVLTSTSSRRVMVSILSKLTFCVDRFEVASSPQDIQQWALAIRSVIETAEVVSKSSIPDISDEQ